MPVMMFKAIEVELLDTDWIFLCSQKMNTALETHPECRLNLTGMINMASHSSEGIALAKQNELRAHFLTREFVVRAAWLPQAKIDRNRITFSL